ncbi:MAG TPA: hypothetical protein VLM17_08975, partial [Xanthomonadaceae bacterium]|nr:hypothetical protein [Xanthomonadaceae bacterium]
MRQVFSSPRLENVERVAQLLREAGIETRVTHGRSYKGSRRGDFSYRDHTREEPVPAVWIVNSEDQVRGREILRQAGLIDTTRTGSDSFLPASMHRREQERKADAGERRAFRLKMGLIAVIAIVVVLAFVTQRKTELKSPAVRAVNPALPAGVAPTPDALAVAVLAGELPIRPGQAACLSVDGGDPSASLLVLLAPKTPGAVLPASHCPARGDVPTLAIHDYRPRAGGRAGPITLD